MLTENVQRSIKYFVKSGDLTPEEFKVVADACGSDQKNIFLMTKYATLLKSSGFWEKNPEIVPERLWRIYGVIKSYNPVVFPVEGYNVSFKEESESPDIDVNTLNTLLNRLQLRNQFVEKLKRYPSRYFRNMRDEFKRPFDSDNPDFVQQFNTITAMLRNFRDELPDGEDDPKYQRIVSVAFSSENPTFYDALSFLMNQSVADRNGVLDRVEDMDGEAEIVFERNNVSVIKIMSQYAMEKLCGFTNWCFARPRANMDWHSYASLGYVYVVIDEEGRFFTILPSTWELYDEDNHLVSERGGKTFLKKLGYTPPETKKKRENPNY